MITVMIIDHESLALETGNTTKCMSCAPTIDLQAISNKQQPMSNEQQAMTHRLSVHCLDRKSVVQGKSVDLGGRRIIKKKRPQQSNN